VVAGSCSADNRSECERRHHPLSWTSLAMACANLVGERRRCRRIAPWAAGKRRGLAAAVQPRLQRVGPAARVIFTRERRDLPPMFLCVSKSRTLFLARATRESATRTAQLTRIPSGQLGPAPRSLKRFEQGMAGPPLAKSGPTHVHHTTAIGFNPYGGGPPIIVMGMHPSRCKTGMSTRGSGRGLTIAWGKDCRGEVNTMAQGGPAGASGRDLALRDRCSILGEGCGTGTQDSRCTAGSSTSGPAQRGAPRREGKPANHTGRRALGRPQRRARGAKKRAWRPPLAKNRLMGTPSGFRLVAITSARRSAGEAEVIGGRSCPNPGAKTVCSTFGRGRARNVRAR